MKKIFFLVAVLVAFTPVFAQKGIWVKGFYDITTQPRYQFFLLKADTFQKTIRNENNPGFSYLLSVAIEQNENLFWEVGFRGIGNKGDVTISEFPISSITTSVGKYDLKDFTLLVSRNQRQFDAKNGSANWRYFIGIAFDGQFRRTTFESSDIKYWSNERAYSGITFSIIPRLQRLWRERFLFEMAPHFGIVSAGFESEFVDNPNILSALRRTDWFDLTIFQTIGGRFGMAYRLNKLKKEGPDRVD